MTTKTHREKITQGITVKRETSCGDIYVTINRNENGGAPIELFAVLGKAGGCTRCQNEALTRVMSIGLKYGVPIQEFIENLEDIQCPSPKMWPLTERSLSCADAIARILKEYVCGEATDS